MENGIYRIAGPRFPFERPQGKNKSGSNTFRKKVSMGAQ
jgi:hypothetical protein